MKTLQNACKNGAGAVVVLSLLLLAVASPIPPEFIITLAGYIPAWAISTPIGIFLGAIVVQFATKWMAGFKPTYGRTCLTLLLMYLVPFPVMLLVALVFFLPGATFALIALLVGVDGKAIKEAILPAFMYLGGFGMLLFTCIGQVGVLMWKLNDYAADELKLKDEPLSQGKAFLVWLILLVFCVVSTVATDALLPPHHLFGM